MFGIVSKHKEKIQWIFAAMMLMGFAVHAVQYVADLMA